MWRGIRKVDKLNRSRKTLYRSLKRIKSEAFVITSTFAQLANAEYRRRSSAIYE